MDSKRYLVFGTAIRNHMNTPAGGTVKPRTVTVICVIASALVVCFACWLADFFAFERNFSSRRDRSPIRVAYVRTRRRASKTFSSFPNLPSGCSKNLEVCCRFPVRQVQLSASGPGAGVNLCVTWRKILVLFVEILKSFFFLSVVGIVVVEELYCWLLLWRRSWCVLACVHCA